MKFVKITMDAISHIYFAKEYIKNNPNFASKINNYEHFLFSNIFSDFDLLQLAFSKKKTIDLHNYNFKNLNEILNDTIYGILFHGENINGIHGLDYFTHKNGGYIDKYRKYVKNVLEQNDVYLYDDFEHPVIEIISGYKIASKDKELKNIVDDLFNNFDEHYWKALDDLPFGRGKLYSTLYSYFAKLVANKYKKIIDDPVNVLINIYRGVNKKLFIRKKKYERLYNQMNKVVKELYSEIDPETFLIYAGNAMVINEIPEYETGLVYQTSS